MGASQSSPEQRESGEQTSWLWYCFGSNERAYGEVAEKHASYKENKEAVRTHGNDHVGQPQPRPQSSRIRSDREGETTTSGQWFASAMDIDTVKNAELPPLAPPENTESKKRKRSLSHVFARRSTTRRPMTAPGRSHPAEWRVSLRSWGPSSPFPDFSTFSVQPAATDDNRSSCTYVDALSRRASNVAPVDWPLPRDPSGYPLLETRRTSGTETDGNMPGIGNSQQHGAEPKRIHSKRTYVKEQSARRARALSEPFRYVRRARPSTSQTERREVTVEIQELQSLVEARRAASKPAPAEPNRDSGLTRVKSKGHVPAIAPSMKVSVRSQILSDIGSAFSKPLPSHKQSPATEKTPEMDSDGNMTQATIAQNWPSTIQSPEPFYSDVPARAIGHNFGEDSTTSMETPTLRSSISSIATTVSDVSVSHFPTAPSTPPLSRPSTSQRNDESPLPSNNQTSIPPPPTRKAPAPPDASATNRSSNFVSGIWTAARDSVSLEIFHRRSSSKNDAPSGHTNVRISDIKPPPPLKATLKQRK